MYIDMGITGEMMMKKVVTYVERCICICGAVTFYFDIVSAGLISVHNDAEL